MPRLLAARVVWARAEAGGREVGLRFRARDLAGRRRAREIVRRLVLARLDHAPPLAALGLGPR